MRITISWKLLLFLVLTTPPALSFDEVDVKKFQAVGDCEKCDLSGVDFSDANLSGATLLQGGTTRIHSDRVELNLSAGYIGGLQGTVARGFRTMYH